MRRRAGSPEYIQLKRQQQTHLIRHARTVSADSFRSYIRFQCDISLRGRATRNRTSQNVLGWRQGSRKSFKFWVGR